MNQQEDFERLVHRMNRTYGCFLLWKEMRISLSIPESGQKEAERRAGIMNRYGGNFSAFLYALENAFITDLHKFFDKPRASLKLQTFLNKIPDEDRKEAESLLKSIEAEVGRIKTLRNNTTAHEPITPQEEKIYTQEIEKIFATIQKVLNIVSKSFGGTFMTWELWENNTKQSFSVLLNDLEEGYKFRLSKIGSPDDPEEAGK